MGGLIHYSEYRPRDFGNSDILTLIEKASSDYTAYLVVKFAAHITTKHARIPALHEWRNAELLEAYKPPKRKSGKSACDVVVAALKQCKTSISYDSVESILAKRDKRPSMEFLKDAIIHGLLT
ncbi:MAG: hypothetical protein HRU33_22315 [Rhodobacteraceae bacterium]|nr:hypothetical protein [Paracoccaceae bacterium]